MVAGDTVGTIRSRPNIRTTHMRIRSKPIRTTSLTTTTATRTNRRTRSTTIQDSIRATVPTAIPVLAANS